MCSAVIVALRRSDGHNNLDFDRTQEVRRRTAIVGMAAGWRSTAESCKSLARGQEAVVQLPRRCHGMACIPLFYVCVRKCTCASLAICCM